MGLGSVEEVKDRKPGVKKGGTGACAGKAGKKKAEAVNGVKQGFAAAVRPVYLFCLFFLSYHIACLTPNPVTWSN